MVVFEMKNEDQVKGKGTRKDRIKRDDAML